MTIVSLFTAAAITFPVAPHAAAANTSLEAESMVVSPANAGRVIADSSASGGYALELYQNSTASTNLSLPASISVVIRAKGQSCLGAPRRMTVLIDGNAISETTVSATSWTNYTTAATINAGTHTLSIAFTNARQRPFCSRALFLDTVTVVAGTSGTGPTGTPVTITAATPNWNHIVPTTYAYQPAGSYWWAYNLAVENPPGPQWVQYYPDNFPNYTTCGWTNSSAFGGYPELVYGIQGPNDSSFGTSMGPLGTAGLPPWVNTPLSSLSHINFAWNLTTTANAAANNDFDVLTETWLGPAGGTGHETGFILKRPAGWWPQTAYQQTIGGVNYYFVPNAWATGSLAIMPASVYNGTAALASGSVDLLPILSYAASQGWTSMSYVLKGWEFGCEYTTGSGSVTWNNISFTVS